MSHLAIKRSQNVSRVIEIVRLVYHHYGFEVVYTRLAHYSVFTCTEVQCALLDILPISFQFQKKGRGSVFYLVSTCKFHPQQNTYSALSYQRNLVKMLATTSYISSVKCCWSFMLLQSNGLL